MRDIKLIEIKLFILVYHLTELSFLMYHYATIYMLFEVFGIQNLDTIISLCLTPSSKYFSL